MTRRTSLSIGLAACCLALTAAAAPAHADGAAVLHANLSPVNQSGAHGTAKVTVKGTRVTVHIESGGLLAHSPHAQHFHIGGQHRCAPPEAADDITDDGRLSTTEGEPYRASASVARTWDTWTDDGGDTGYAARVSDTTVLVFGSASTEVLTGLVESLTDAPVAEEQVPESPNTPS